MNKAPTPEHIIELRYAYLKQTQPQRIMHFEEALNIRITTGGKAFKVSCTSDEDYELYAPLVDLLGYPPLYPKSWDHHKGMLTIKWRDSADTARSCCR